MTYLAKARPAQMIFITTSNQRFVHFKFPYIHFSGTKTTGDNIFPLFWDVVKRFERIGLKVEYYTPS